MSERWTRFATMLGRGRILAIACWAILAILGALGTQDLNHHLHGDDWVMPDTEAGHVDARLTEAFGSDTSRIDMAVFRDAHRSVEDPGYRAEALDRLGRLQRSPGVARVVSYYSLGDRHLISPDGHTTYALVFYSASRTALAQTIPRYRALLASTGSLEVLLTGRSSFSYDLDRASQADLAHLEIWTMPLVFGLLVLVFGSWLSALLPLVLGATTVATAMGVLAIVARCEALSTFAPNTASMMGLGLGIDFSLLFVSRFREELGSGTVTEALKRTMRTAGRSILYSGLTLSAGMVIVYLLSAQISVLRSLSAAIVVVTLLSVASALTLLPALLFLLASRVGLRPEVTARRMAGGARWSRLVMRTPWRWVILSTTILVVLAGPMVQMRRGFPGFNAIQPQFESRQGLVRLWQAFGAGEINPVYLTARTSPRGIWSRGFRAGLSRWVARLQRDPRILRVDAWPNAVGPARLMSLSPMQLAFDPLTALRSAPWVNLQGAADTAMVRLIPRASVETPEVRQLVLDLRADRARQELGPLGVEVLVGGMPANTIDFVDGIYQRFPAMIAGIVLVTFCVLLVFLRSVWLPIKAIVMTCASIAASYGMLVLVFQHGWGAPLIGLVPPGHLTAIVPILLFGVLFGLSTDYEVFLLTRVRELHLGGASDEAAVAGGLAATGRIITTAAVVMVAVFATFAYSGVTVIKEIGVGLALGVLLDATLVRVILVPATMRLMGRWNWWLPEWLERWLPKLSHGEPQEAPKPQATPR